MARPAGGGRDAREPQPGLVVEDVLLAVDEARRLCRDGRSDPRVGMAGVRDADAGRVVEESLAGARDEPGALAAVHVELGVARPHGWHDGVIGQRAGRRCRRAWDGRGRRARSSSEASRSRCSAHRVQLTPSSVRTSCASRARPRASMTSSERRSCTSPSATRPARRSASPQPRSTRARLGRASSAS